MLWTKEQLPLHIRSKPEDILKAGLLAANTALSKGLSQDEATFVCLQRIKSLEVRFKPTVEPRVIPSHVSSLLKQNIVQELVPAVIKQAFLGKNALVPNPDRSLVNADFNKRNQLVLTFNTGEVIKTRAIKVNELIEQHLTVTDNTSGESTSKFTVGEITITSATKSLDTNYLVADGSVYLQSAYPELFLAVGLPTYPPNTKLATPLTVPPGAASGMSISGDGGYFVVGTGAPPFVTVYKLVDSTYVNVATPVTIPPGAVSGVSMSGDGIRMSVTTGAPPYITNYKRTADLFIAQTAPTVIPPAAGAGCGYSYDGRFMGVVYGAPPYITNYKVVDDLYTALPVPVNLPLGAASAVSFSGDGSYSCVLSGPPPYLNIYKRNGDIMIGLATPNVIPPGASSSASFSSDGLYLVISHAAAPYLTIYKNYNDVYTKIANPVNLPLGAASSATLTSDGKFLAVTYGAAPFLNIYKRKGNTFNRLPALVNPPIGAATLGAISGSGNVVGLVEAPPPYMSSYLSVAPFNTQTEFQLPNVGSITTTDNVIDVEYLIRAKP